MLYNRGYGSVEYRSVEDVLTIEFTNEPPVTAKPVTVTRAIEAPSTAGATPVEMVLTLPPMQNNKSEFRINGVPFWKAKPFSAKLGEKQIWIVKNDSDWDHPFHLHGFFFHVLDDKGEPVRPLALKDTVNVPMKSTVRVAGGLRRAARRVDDSLPHPRSRRGRPDGDGAGRRRCGPRGTPTRRVSERASVARASPASR